jgi:hypothetical protein
MLREEKALQGLVFNYNSMATTRLAGTFCVMK